MLVKDIMTTTVVTIAPGQTVDEACGLMKKKNIRHLPVLEGDSVVGVVTDRDVLGASSSLMHEPCSSSKRIAEVMSKPPVTADPLDPVESAAHTMRRLKIGCLPVVAGDALVGIVTGIDLLDALLQLTGVGVPSGRLELSLPDRPGELARLAALISERGINIHSLLSYPDANQVSRIVVRVNTMETRPLAEALGAAGFRVVWPAEKPWQR
jgi:acetoin utilization protein AcuB